MDRDISEVYCIAAHRETLHDSRPKNRAFKKMNFFNYTVPNFLYTENDPKRTHEKYETVRYAFDPPSPIEIFAVFDRNISYMKKSKSLYALEIRLKL